jgi:hypothetical protein
MKLREFERQFKAITHESCQGLAKSMLMSLEQRWIAENGSKPPYELIRS